MRERELLDMRKEGCAVSLGSLSAPHDGRWDLFSHSLCLSFLRYCCCSLFLSLRDCATEEREREMGCKKRRMIKDTELEESTATPPWSLRPLFPFLSLFLSATCLSLSLHL